MSADLFEAVDVGIDEFSLHGRSIKGLVCGQAVSEITYIHIHECDSFSVSIKIFLRIHVFALKQPKKWRLEAMICQNMMFSSYELNN